MIHLPYLTVIPILALLIVLAAAQVCPLLSESRSGVHPY
jgi:hypothetical protein